MFFQQNISNLEKPSAWKNPTGPQQLQTFVHFESQRFGVTVLELMDENAPAT